VITIGNEIGLTSKGKAKLRQYHPFIQDLGSWTNGSKVEVEVLPFRVALLKVTTKKETDKVALSGIPYQIINGGVGGTTSVRLLGKPGETYQVRLESDAKNFKTATVNAGALPALLSGKPATITFPGEKTDAPYHCRLSGMEACEVPADAGAIYYATCYAADNNALEVRSLQRSGPTAIPEVRKARDAFFTHEIFQGKELWDKYLFDDNQQTAFSINMRDGEGRTVAQSAFLLDLGENTELDKLVIQTANAYSLAPQNVGGGRAYISSDLKEWRTVSFPLDATSEVDLSQAGAFRYFRFSPCPIRLTEVTGYRGGIKADRSKWKASNLFKPYQGAKKAWKSSVTLEHIHKGGYLCVALNGSHGVEGAWVGFKIDGRYIGSPDRAPSFAANVWEYPVAKADKNYTYYLPLTADMAGKKIEVYVLGFNKEVSITPDVWVTAYPIPFDAQTLKITK
jgi:hypothetical protein